MNSCKIIILCALVPFLFFSHGCAQGETYFIDQSGLEKIILDHENVLIIDVREPHERHGPLGKIPGSLNIPLGLLEQGITSVDLDPDTVIVLLCRTQNRSQTAYQVLGKMDFSKIYVLKGGMMNYNHQQPIPSRE
ncbi:MAG: rhodanese-like domain-containing protein [Desulfonatronovibrio sp. MSAO_Bac4]|nr:MAG: rhodanese-like domain-containing protein [Desulfonatronovibrio sp. MSAO_Bac4]